jgi:BirA family transcriptional regulator, biotin operon repressor / biotin---[acetyl-CoA-carboxylase] ligase
LLGEPRIHEPECASTQELLLGTDLPEGAIATTDHQTAGRGRQGRAWEDSPGSSLLMSVLLRPPAEARQEEISLVCAAAVAQAVEDTTDLSAQIKWPNDVMLDRRKVGGILLEARDGAVVAGIGVNLNQTTSELPSQTKATAGSLRTVTGLQFDREEVLTAVLRRLDVAYTAWRERGLDAVFAEIGSRNYLFGRRVRVAAGEGTGGAIARDGRLHVALGHGDPVLVESGEVELLAG